VKIIVDKVSALKAICDAHMLEYKIVNVKGKKTINVEHEIIFDFEKGETGNGRKRK
jgi:hypothetical protein